MLDALRAVAVLAMILIPVVMLTAPRTGSRVRDHLESCGECSREESSPAACPEARRVSAEAGQGID